MFIYLFIYQCQTIPKVSHNKTQLLVWDRMSGVVLTSGVYISQLNIL